jgi:hypothetical protein
MIPKEATSQPKGHGTFTYQFRSPSSPHEVRGTWIGYADSKGPFGFVAIEVSLPERDSELRAAILRGFESKTHITRG